MIRAPKVISASTPGCYAPVLRAQACGEQQGCAQACHAAAAPAVPAKSVEQLQEELAAAERHVAVLRDELSTARWRREFEETPPFEETPT